MSVLPLMSRRRTPGQLDNIRPVKVQETMCMCQASLWQLDIFHRPGGNAVGPIEEVSIVGRPTGDEEKVLFWTFQGRNGRLGVVLQMLQLRVDQPCAAGIPGHASRAQRGLQRDAT